MDQGFCEMHEASQIEAQSFVRPGTAVRCGPIIVQRSHGGNRLCITFEDSEQVPLHVRERLDLYGFEKIPIPPDYAQPDIEMFMRRWPLTFVMLHQSITINEDVIAIMAYLNAEFSACE